MASSGLQGNERIVFAAAREVFRRRLQNAQDYPAANECRKGLIRCNLELGEFESAWLELATFMESYREHNPPGGRRWKGEPLIGQTLLVVDEYGFGDSIQFIRFARAVKETGASVIIHCRPELSRLYDRQDFVDAAMPWQQPGDPESPNYDYYAPILDLPSLVSQGLLSYDRYLTVDHIDVAGWRRRLESPSAFKVGIVWAAGRENGRSRPIMDFQPLAAMRDTQVYSLQMGPAAADAAQLPSVVSLSEYLYDFYETSCAIMALDLVISVDTAVAHLAGALGKDVWTIMPDNPGWRWYGAPSSQTPWYPSMRLYRETDDRPWAMVVRRMEQDLQNMVTAVR
jgi:hypothetical protein